jgi:hypothetical protein
MDSVETFRCAQAGFAVWVKAIGTIDTSAAKVIAWVWFLMSNERNLEHVKKVGNGNLPRMEIEVPNCRSKFQITGVKLPGAISNRLFASLWTWRKEDDGTLVIAGAPHAGKPAQQYPAPLSQ